MSTQDSERVFSQEHIRRASVTGFAVGLFVPLAATLLGALVHWLMQAVVSPPLAALAGLAVAVGSFAVAADYLALGWFNRRLRRKLTDKLRRAGTLALDESDPNTYFVGLAHPAYAGTLRLETDDDIGFLTVRFDGLAYHGDRVWFDVPWSAVESVELEPLGYFLPSAFKRIRIRFADGEPFDDLLFCAREGDRLTTGNHVTRALHEAIASRWERHGARRLAASALSLDEAAEAGLTDTPLTPKG